MSSVYYILTTAGCIIEFRALRTSVIAERTLKIFPRTGNFKFKQEEKSLNIMKFQYISGHVFISGDVCSKSGIGSRYV